MIRTVDTRADFLAHWNCGINFFIGGECIPFVYEFPPIDRIIEALLANPNMIAISGTMPEKLEVENIAQRYRKMSYDDLMATSFQLTHFNLSEFDKPGQILDGFHERVVAVWKAFLTDNDFTWDRCYGVMRVSGPNTVTGYHMDGSNVLFWNVRGHKQFHGVHNPDKWAPIDWAVKTRNADITRPPELTDEDILTLDVGDNQFVWNHLLTPHWVDAPALTFGINLSHGGLRHKGRLCQREKALYRFKEWDKYPEKIWRKD